MSTDLFHRYGHLLKADGTNQLQRALPALEGAYIRPDERTLKELIEYARAVAGEIRFYNLSGQQSGDWRPLFEPFLRDPSGSEVLTTPEIESAIAGRNDWPPHVALFLAFLQLFKHLQDDLNELPSLHLAHYYEKVLHLARRGAEPDAVHVLFELARNAAPTLLAQSTLLDGGKDGEGRPLVYSTQEDVTVSHATVAEIRRLVAETDRRGNRRFFVSDAITDAEKPSWETFGADQLGLDASQRLFEEAQIGFAIAAPILRLGEGDRSVQVDLELRATGGALPGPQRIDSGLIAELTSEEGWLPPDSFTATIVDGPGPDRVTLRIKIAVGPGAPAIVPFDAALHGPTPASDWPVLRCLLRGEAGHYGTLNGLVVERGDISVSVQGVRDVVVQNEQGPLTPDQPMAPFGSQPRLGSAFYVGSAEVFSKKLSSLKVSLEWQDIPSDLFQYYRAYFFTAVSPDFIAAFPGGFRLSVDLLHERTWNTLLANQSLFGVSDPNLRLITASQSAFDSAFAGSDYKALPYLTELAQYTAQSKQGFLRMVLAAPSYGASEAIVGFDAFGHKAFARLYADRAIALSRWDGVTLPAPELPNAPVTPMLAGLALDYEAHAEIVPGDVHAPETLFLIEPWGYAETGGDIAPCVVPELDAPPSAAGVEFRAALFLGIDGLDAPSTLSLLFQMDAGTAATSEILGIGDTEWSYLSGSTWRRLAPEAVLNDGTYGFQEPGLVVLTVGQDATKEHSSMPSKLVWLRALIRRPPASASRTVALHAQAALATFEPTVGALTEYSEHLASGIGPDTVTRLSRRQGAIKRVSQPFGSFGGRDEEGDDAFFIRVSERLRHRNRAVTAWDLERLVLEAFPGVFKVKCLPHRDVEVATHAGQAVLVIVPDLRNSENANILEPRAGAVLMDKIGAYVSAGRASGFAEVHVIHPVYERLLVDARVAFKSGFDPGFYSNVLNDDLVKFLSPWAFDEGEDIVFGARIYASELLGFMEGREYVDYVTDFGLYHSFSGPPHGGVGDMSIGVDFVVGTDPTPVIGEMAIGADLIVGTPVEAAETSLPHAILVSRPSHRIHAITPGEELCTGVEVLGIGFMTVGLDFDIHPL